MRKPEPEHRMTDRERHLEHCRWSSAPVAPLEIESHVVTGTERPKALRRASPARSGRHEVVLDRGSSSEEPHSAGEPARSNRASVRSNRTPPRSLPVAPWKNRVGCRSDVTQALRAVSRAACAGRATEEPDKQTVPETASAASKTAALTPQLSWPRWPIVSPPRRARTCSSTRTTRSTGTRGATRRSRGRAPRTSRSCSPSATRPATGAT